MGWTFVTVGSYAHYGVKVRTDIDYNMMRAFCEYCKMRGYEGRESGDDGLTRMIQILANYYNDGIVTLEGITITSIKWIETYVIYDWEIHSHFIDGRTIFCEDEEKGDILELLLKIDETQPEPLGKEYIRANYESEGTDQKAV